MNKITAIFIGIVIAALIILIVKSLNPSEEGWYPTTTYVNSPITTGVYPNRLYNWRGGNYYDRLNWQPWGYHRPDYYRRGPILTDSGVNLGAPIPYGNSLAAQRAALSLTGAEPRPVPLDTIRWGGMFGPMLTSIKSPKDYYIGRWVAAGSAYTDNPNDFTFVDVEQLNLDPGRDMFSYRVRTKDGQVIPINLRQNHNRLEDGDRFKIQGMEGKGDFVFSEADKYTYVYT